jgi:hypothetical protein
LIDGVVQSVDLPCFGKSNASMPRGVKRGRDAGVCVICDCVAIIAGCDGSVSTPAAWCLVQQQATATMLVWLV